MPNFSLSTGTGWTAQLPDGLASSQRLLASHLPQGFPSCLTSHMVWDRADMQGRPEKYQFVLNERQIREVETAAEYFQGRPRLGGHVSVLLSSELICKRVAIAVGRRIRRDVPVA